MVNIEKYVLSAIADDYEEFEKILSDVKVQAVESGLVVSSELVREALQGLITKGLARAYRLASRPPHAETVPYSADALGELWFYVTPEGKKFVESLQQ
jgi:hypothetical protein